MFANVVLNTVLLLSLIDFLTRNGHRNKMTPDLDSSQYEDSKNTKFVSVRQELKVMQRDLCCAANSAAGERRGCGVIAERFRRGPECTPEGSEFRMRQTECKRRVSDRQQQ